MTNASRANQRVARLAAATVLVICSSGRVVWAQPSTDDEDAILFDWVGQAQIVPELGPGFEYNPLDLEFGPWLQVYHPRTAFIDGFTSAPFADDLVVRGPKWAAAVHSNGLTVGAAVATEDEGDWSSRDALDRGSANTSIVASPATGYSISPWKAPGGWFTASR